MAALSWGVEHFSIPYSAIVANKISKSCQLWVAKQNKVLRDNLDSENGFYVLLLDRSIQDLSDHVASKEPKTLELDSSVPLTNHDPKGLKLISLVILSLVFTFPDKGFITIARLRVFGYCYSNLGAIMQSAMSIYHLLKSILFPKFLEQLTCPFSLINANFRTLYFSTLLLPRAAS